MADEDLAKRRWQIIQLARLGTAFVTMLGILIVSGRLVAVPALGYILLVAGSAGFFILPRKLARRWKSPDR